VGKEHFAKALLGRQWWNFYFHNAIDNASWVDRNSGSVVCLLRAIDETEAPEVRRARDASVANDSLAERSTAVRAYVGNGVDLTVDQSQAHVPTVERQALGVVLGEFTHRKGSVPHVVPISWH
jgi:hypothetical protein